MVKSMYVIIKKTILEFFVDELIFLGEGCARRFRIAILPQFLTFNTDFVRRVAPDTSKWQFYPGFERPMDTKRCACLVSRRSGGTAPASREKEKKSERKRERGRERERETRRDRQRKERERERRRDRQRKRRSSDVKNVKM